MGTAKPNEIERSELLQALGDRRDAIVNSWRGAIARTSFTPLTATELRRRLEELTAQAITLLLSDTFDRREARGIGSALAEMHYLNPEALSRTQQLLATQLLEDVPIDRAVGLQPRLAALLAEIGAGFFGQARDTILSEQEQIKVALLSERRRVEDALRRSEDSLAEAQRIAHLGHWDYDWVNDTLVWSEEIYRIFGVTESEMLLDHGRFAEIVSLRRAPLVSDSLAGPLHHVELLYAASKSLDRYVGYYFRYFYSFGRAGKIVKSLASLYEKNGRYYWKNIEIHRPNAPGSGPTTTKYTGVVFFLGERIFIIEYESMLKNAITQVTLYPSYHTRMTRLRGIQTGAPTARGRKPGASLVLMEYLGRRIHVRDALRSSGMFAEDDPAIDPAVRELIVNRIPAGSYVLEADEI
jgi:PAS domain-containing protein